MTLGLAVWGVPAEQVVGLCRDVERAGFDAVWLAEHLVLPAGYETDHPTVGGGHELGGRPVIDLDTELLDPWVGLSGAAVATTSLGLGTGIYLLNLRHPLVTARAAVSLQQLSGGRLSFGVGVGWLREEFDALGVPFAGRGRRFEEALAVFRAVCGGGPVSHDGEFFSFDSVQVTPRPTPIPLVLGGNTDRALKRAVIHGDGWMCSGFPTLDEAVDLVRRIGRFREELGIDRPFELHFRVPGCDPAVVSRYRDVGIDNLVLFSDHVFAERPVSDARHILRELVVASA